MKTYYDGSTAISYIRRAIKKQLVLYKGGSCARCGYNRDIRALQLHHRNPEEKSFESIRRGTIVV